MPAPEAVRAAWRPSDVRLLDREGTLLHELRVDPRRRRLAWTPLLEVSPALGRAVVRSEDRRFHRHRGVDWRALGAAAVRRLTGGPPRGASTISMQVAALVDPALRRQGGPRTPWQKWRQMRLAWALERRWSKDEILEAYLNLATFRGELDGVAAAAHVLFGKAPHGLGDAEALVMAALLRAPNAPADALARRARDLDAGRAVEPAALAEAVGRAAGPARGEGPRIALAPHVAHRLLPRPATAGAPSVRTTLDATLQRVAAEALRQRLGDVASRHVQDGAVLVADNASGDVLAYVGGSGDLSSARWVDGVRARRQAGSALKPFLYALALDERLLTPASLLDDSPLEVAVASGLYRPHNYDERFRGLVSARTALAASLNVPAVRVLGLVGEEAFAARLRRLGFEGLVESGDFYGPALALGAADVSLWELVNAYRALASGGLWRPLRLVPEDAPEGPRRAYSNAAAFLVAHVLADRESRSATFGLENPLATPFWAAVKTGTSKDMRDNWCVGFTVRHTVGVWVGNFSGEPMRNVSGVTGAAPVWLDVMAWLHRTAPAAPPAPPPGVVTAAAAERREVELFMAGTEPTRASRLDRQAHPRIVAPVSGTRIALDPDIPADRQRVALEALGQGPGGRWTLDGVPLAPAEGLVLWAPRPGRHTLALEDASGRTLDTATVEVRGAVR